MTPDQEAHQIVRAWGCGGDSGAMAMVRAVLLAERERCAKVAEGMNYGGQTEYDKGRTYASQDIASAIRAPSHAGQSTPPGKE